MSRRNSLAWQALGLFSACVACAACGSCRGRPRSAVVLYCSVDQAVAEPIIAAFEQQTGIAVRARFDTEASKTVGLARKIEAEAKRPAADVFWSNEIFYTIRLARKGLLQPYRGGETSDWPADLADEQGRWYGFALRARVIAYNTRKVTAAEAPKTLEELLSATWRGRIAMARPIAGTTVGDVSSWFVHYGAVRAKEILAGLAANRVRLVDGNSLAVRAVAQGEADVCLTDTDDVYAAQRNGWPVAMHLLDQGGAGCLVIPNTAGLVRGGPNGEGARRLMAFLLSAAVERMLAESDSHNTPVRADLAATYARYAIPKRLGIDYGKVADGLPQAVALAEEILPD